MFVAVIKWPQEKPGSGLSAISVAFTGISKDEVIKRALNYRKSNSTAHSCPIYVGAFDEEVVTPEMLYDLKPFKDR